MAQKIVFDLKEVTRAAAANERQPAIAKALGTNAPVLGYNLRTNEEFREAYNAGRTKGGFALYQPRSGAAANGNGNGHAPARPRLDQFTEEVLDTITAVKEGITLGNIEIATGGPTLQVSNAIRTLARNELIRSDGAKYFAVAGPGSDPLPAPARASRANTPPPQIEGHKAEVRSPRSEVRRGRERQRRHAGDRRLFGHCAGGESPGAGARRVALRAGAWGGVTEV